MPTPTPIDVRARAKAKTKLNQYGRTLVLRKQQRLETKSGPNAGSVLMAPFLGDPDDPTEDSILTVVGDLPQGIGDGTFLTDGGEGLVVTGDQFRIDAPGHEDQVYTVTSVIVEVSPAVPGVIEFTPNLVAEVPDETECTLIWFGTDHRLKGLPTQIERRFIDGEVTRAGDMQFLIAQQTVDELGIEILAGDEIFQGDDPREVAGLEVLRTSAISSGELDAVLYVFAGER